MATASSSTTPSECESCVVELDDGLETTEWIVIVIVLVIILIALIIAVAKCLELSPEKKALVLQESNSVRSSFRTSPYASATNTMASSKGRSLNKMPLNAEITRLSAGRVSRSAQYGVVIRDIGKTATEQSVMSDPPASTVSPPPGYYDTSRYADTPEDTMIQRTLPVASVNVGRLAPPNSKAVFQAPDEDFATAYSGRTPRMIAQPVGQQAILLDAQYLNQGQMRY